LASGYQHLGLMPEVEGEGRKWRFMGVYAKNREEWTISDMASLRQSGTTIAFYDTLGPAAVEYVIKQTELTTISCAGNYLRTLVMLKSQGRADSLQNLVSFDAFDDDVKSDAEEAGLKIFHISAVIKAGQENREAAEF
jgi:long-chain acyl-CoA synthetase